jgi:N utilization substance protein B
MKARRSKARQLVVQALYQWQMTGTDMGAMQREFLGEQSDGRFDVDYFQELLRGITGQASVLDERLGPFLDRPIARLDPVERAILRLAAFELMYRPEVPYRVAINEAVQLAKIFGATEGHKYVNGVLDRLARQERQAEMNDSA